LGRGVKRDSISFEIPIQTSFKRGRGARMCIMEKSPGKEWGMGPPKTLNQGTKEKATRRLTRSGKRKTPVKSSNRESVVKKEQ